MAENYIPQVGDKLNKYYFFFGEEPEYRKHRIVITSVQPSKVEEDFFTIKYDEFDDADVATRHSAKINSGNLDGYYTVFGGGLHIFLVKGNKTKAKAIVKKYLERRCSELEAEWNNFFKKIEILGSL